MNQLTQYRALERLSEINEVKDQIALILKERDLLITELNSISFIKTIYPSDANFVLAKVDDADLRYKQLIDNGIVVRNRTKQPLCKNCLRFTIGTQEENKKLIRTLNQLS